MSTRIPSDDSASFDARRHQASTPAPRPATEIVESNAENVPASSPVFTNQTSSRDSSPTVRIVTAIVIFTMLRVLLVVVLVLPMLPFLPLMIALLLAVIIQLPLSMVLFGRQRAAVTSALGVSMARRRAARAQLREALRGEDLN